MGMFDYVKCDVPLPDGYAGDCQTKDFDCFMSTLLISSDGRLMIEDFDWEEVPLEERPNSWIPFFGSYRLINKRWRDLDFHGDFRFYGSREGADWHDYLARFTHGNLETIIVIPEAFYKRAVMSGGATRILLDETRASSAYADQVIGKAQREPTIGRELDDVIATLSEAGRRELEDRVAVLIMQARGERSTRE